MVLHPRFHEVATKISSVSGFASDARYAVVDSAAGGMWLIDDQTGRRTRLTPPTLCGGYGDLVGGGWVLTSCVGYGDSPYQLYSIATGTWTVVNSSGGLPVAIGSDWIEFYGPTELGCTEHCGYQYRFENIASGQLQTLPTWVPGATTIPDLNSPGLAALLCSPLHVPQGFPEEDTAVTDAPDPLIFAGVLAVGIQWYQPGDWQPRLVLERCGSRLHRVVTNQISSANAPQFAINNHALVWLSDGTIDGVFLPSLQKFTIVGGAGPSTGPGPVLPPAPYGVFLTSRTLYVETENGAVVAAASPIPRTHHRRHER